MTHHWDEFSKSLAETTIPRRETLRLFGAALAGALLGPLLGMKSARAGNPDPCKAFCRCRNKSQQNACLAACNACGRDTSRLCGTCGGGYVCCDRPGTYENGACVSGRCEYWCASGAVECNGICTSLADDPYNCGACGNVCDRFTPYCDLGVCNSRGAICGPWTDFNWDSSNCGYCGNVCPWGTACSWGVCTGGGGDGGL